MVREYSRRTAPAAKRDSYFPAGYLAGFANQGLSGITIGEQEGGQGSGLLDAILAIEAAATISLAAGDALHVLNFGAVQQLARLGSEELKQSYLGPCLAGELLVAIAMSEPSAGSAVTELKTSAKLDGDRLQLSGHKIFTTNAEQADLFVVWAHIGDGRNPGCVLVERDTPGFEIDCSSHWVTGEPYGLLYFDGCELPAVNVLLGSEGFASMLPIFNIERLGNAARSLGVGQAAFDHAVAYVREREQFGRRLVEFQGLQWRFAEMKERLESARLLLHRAAATTENGIPSTLDTSLAKLACNKTGFDVANGAMQMLGGYGYDDESELAPLWTRARGWQIAGGSIEQMLNRVASEIFDENFSQRVPSERPNGAGRERGSVGSSTSAV